MSDDEKIPNWFLWLWEHLPVLLAGGVFLAFLAFSSVYFIESRLSDIEDRLNYMPPRTYEPPNLEGLAAADVTSEQLTSQHLVYVPVYSHIYYQGGSPYPLETTLSIRNVDTSEPIYVEAVEYYDSGGELAKTHVDRMLRLAPLQTIEFLIERRDSSGGSGANFLVRWGANSEVNPPLIESIMVGTVGTQGISFGRTGVEIKP